MHEDQPRGAMRLKKEEQVDLELHRDKKKKASGVLAICVWKKVYVYGLEEKWCHPAWNVPSSSEADIIVRLDPEATTVVVFVYL